jgi:hypothetical protein
MSNPKQFNIHENIWTSQTSLCIWQGRCSGLRREGSDILKETMLFAAVLGIVQLGIAQETKAAYSPNDIKILGTIDNGQTSKPVEYSSTPQYRAFVFEGNGHDRVEITVTGADRNVLVALADSSLNVIARGTGRVSAMLPYHGPDTEAFYIVFKDATNQTARMAVHLKKTPGLMQPAAATR